MGYQNDNSGFNVNPNGMATCDGFHGFWYCGKNQPIPDLKNMLAFLDNITPALTEANVMVIGPVTETAEYVMTNTSLTKLNIQYADPDSLHDFGGNQLLDLSNLTSLIGFSLQGGFFGYDFDEPKHFIVTPPSGIASFHYDCYGENLSEDGIDTTFIDGKNGTYVYSGDYANFYVSESSQGGIKDVIWGGGPLGLYGGASTVSIGINSVIDQFIVAGTYADGSGYSNPVVDTTNLVLGSLYVTVTGPIYIKGDMSGIGNVWCDLGMGDIFFESADRLKMSAAFLNEGRIKIHDNGIYTLTGVTLDGLDLEAGYETANLKINSCQMNGTNQGMVGSDYYDAFSSDVLITGTTEQNLYADTTSTYTFFKNAQCLFVESYLRSTVVASNNTYRFYVGGSAIFTYTESTTVDLQFEFKLYRQGTSALRLIAIVLKNGASPSLSQYDISIDPIDNIAIAFTAQNGNAGNQTLQHFRMTKHS